MATAVPSPATRRRRAAPVPLDPVRVVTWALAIALCVAFWVSLAWLAIALV